MDLTTIIGLLLAWGAVFVSLTLEGGKMAELFNISALVLVVFGTIGAAVVGTSMKTLTSVPFILRSALIEDSLDRMAAIDVLVSFARRARREGILSLDADAQRIEDKFLRKSVQLVIDGTPSPLVREILETEIVAMQERHKVAQTLFTTMGGFSPTLGIIGTVMGLINMLARLSEPGKMGHAIASAFVATLYGVGLANLVYLPIASKLKMKSSEEVITYEMIIEGVLAIQAGDSPRVVETRMMAYLSPDLRSVLSSSNDTDHRESRAA